LNLNHGTATLAYNFVIKDKTRIDKNKLEKAKIPFGKHLGELQKGKDIVFNGKKYRAKDFIYVEKGKKISIVLDTVYLDKIINFVKDADLLISESSFGDDSKKIAKEHMHLTSGEAGKIAKKAKVGKLILTHISQRYEKDLKSLLGYAKKNFEEVSIAKDLESLEI
jgi:ribonuclease Z